MPEARDPKPHAPARRASEAERRADLAGIEALIDRLLPALTARLARTHLGELEVREGAWRIRLRRPAAGAAWDGEPRRSTDRVDRSERSARGAAGHEGHAHGRPAVDPYRVPTPGGSNGTGHAAGGQVAGGQAATAHASAGHADDDGPRIATSPAVGVFRPGARATVGTRVREGDSLGNVDVLGVPEEVRAPADGLITELLVEAGTAVEYGQELLVVAAQPGAPTEPARA